MSEMTTTAIAPWFGANRILAKHVGEELSGCRWVGVAFAGGMSELAHIGARTMVVNDFHRHVINMARVAADPTLGPKFYRAVRRAALHPDVLRDAQAECRRRELVDAFDDTPDLDWAVTYFASCWMSRNGTAGTAKEFTAGMSMRWGAGGGDSATRVQSAASSLVAWRRVLRRCSFTTVDAFAFLDKCKDEDEHGVYCDPPFPGPGDAYKHTFGEDGQRRLAEAVGRFKRTRVVMRFYDHPLIRDLYPDWTWVRRTGRKQTNGDASEVLLINGDSRTKELAA